MSSTPEYMKQWRAANKARLQAYMKEYRKSKALEIRAQEKAYKARNADKVKSNWQAYYEKHKSRLLTKRKTEYDANPIHWRALALKSHHKHKPERNKRSLEYIRTHAREIHQYRVANKEHFSQTNKLWRLNNPHKSQAIVHRRRTRLRNAPGASYTTGEHIRMRWEVWGNLCWICRAPAAATDHVIPLVKGGSHWPANLRPICKSCNSRKSAKKTPFSPKAAKAFIFPV